MINAGAIVTVSLLKPGLQMADRFDYVSSLSADAPKVESVQAGLRSGYTSESTLSKSAMVFSPICIQGQLQRCL